MNIDSILDLMPTDTPAYMCPAWLGCIRFALGDESVVRAFREETRNFWEPATTPMDRLVDEATGADWAFLVEFIQWVNVAVWGSLDGPADSSEE